MGDERHETVTDIVREMRALGRLDEKATDKIPRSLQALGLRTYADRIEAAAKQEVTDCNHIGNAAKMREVVEYALDRLLLWNYTNRYTARMALGVVNKLNAAISAPPRNCDRPECATTKSAQDVWRKEDGGKTAYYEWLLATSTKGEANGIQ